MGPDRMPRNGRPEFAFVGRSNVGKSSLLNAMLGKKGLAKTSSTPGKTRTINFFDVNERLYFVDLPGYGFAKVPQTMKRQWQKVMTNYLASREELRLVVMIVDARHPPMATDHEMLAMLDAAEAPTLIVATKIDKVKPSRKQANLKTIRQELELDEDVLIVPFSAVTGEGRHEIWGVIDELVEQR